MPLTKNVNGEVVELTAEEEAAVRAEWAANAAAPAPVPAAVTPLQMRRALRAAGLKAQVDAMVAALDEEAQEAWEYSVTIPRNHALIAAAAAALNLTAGQVDDLFRAAAQM